MKNTLTTNCGKLELIKLLKLAPHCAATLFQLVNRTSSHQQTAKMCNKEVFGLVAPPRLTAFISVPVLTEASFGASGNEATAHAL